MARRLLIPILAALLLTPHLLQATGFEDPLRWIDQQGKTVLDAPDFFFEFEVKRLAAELKPGLKSHVPPRKVENEEARDYEGQTASADTKDFEEALAKGEIKTENHENARAAHNETRRLLGSITSPGGTGDAASPDALPAPPPEPSTSPETITKALDREIPSEFADYHRGAIAFRLGKVNEARTAWENLLARPAGERKYRTTWATFMLGKLAIQEGKWDEAAEWLAKTRTAVRDGFADSIGLGASSLGWEGRAHLEAKRFSEAAKAYLEQMSTGDISAVYSLRDVMSGVFVDGADLKPVVNDLLLQRLATACSVAALGPFSESNNFEAGKDDRSMQWLQALEQADAKNVRDADRVAWIAYSHGEYARAARWLQRADQTSPYALWLKAKLALRDGKVDAALKLLSSALRNLPEDQILESRAFAELEHPPLPIAKGDLGVVHFTRGDFIAALTLFIDGGHHEDAEYLAEGILSIKELKEFLEKHADKKTPPPATQQNEPSESDEWNSPEHIRHSLQKTLARRLTRAGHYAEARPYFDEHEQQILDQYVALLQQAKKPEHNKEQKANALEQAARFLEKEGSVIFEIMDVEVQAARLSGREVTKDAYPAMTLSFGSKLNLPLPITKNERERLKKNSHRPLKHDLSRYLAADLAWQAAALMPDNDERTAKLLNEAGSWLKYRDDGAADRFYQAIERRCAKTELGKEAIKRHWFVPIEETSDKQESENESSRNSESAPSP